MANIILEKPKKIENTDLDTIKYVLNNIINDYSDFDIELMKKYYETRDLDRTHFVNI